MNLAPTDGITAEADLVRDVLEGLSRPQKRLPSKLFYDAYGSQLFDQITELEEYYPTRTEMGIMQRNLDEIVDCLGSGCLLVEYGSGSSLKTRILLEHARDLAGYVPIDISDEHLAATAESLSFDYPHIPIYPIHADYNEDVTLPTLSKKPSHIVVFFPGSTIGNFTPDEAHHFLQRIHDMCGSKGGLLIGVDLQKDTSVLERAYNDAHGVTAEFNLNMLRRINREMNGTFDLARFRHYAFYNLVKGRIEMHLVSMEDHQVCVAGVVIPFRSGETICTEYSYKYTLPAFAALATDAGFDVRRVWTDDHRYFSVQYLEAAV